MTKLISLKEVQSVQESKSKCLKRTFKMIFDQLSEKVRQYAENGHTSCTLVVPEVVWGQPIYNRTYAKEYIMRQFTRLGFKCLATNEFEWVISWKK